MQIKRGLPHNVTTEMDLKLWEVAKAIQNDSSSHNHFTNADADILSKEYLSGLLPQKAQHAIEQFMITYGMRGLYEIDFGRPRWREEPTPLMQTLKTYIDIDEDNAPDKVFAAGETAAEQAIEKLGKDIGRPWLVSFLARRVRAIAGVRELPKFTIIRVMGIIRSKILDEGAELVKKGVIGDAKDLFLLYDNELTALANGILDNCQALIARRKEEMARENDRKRIPRVIASDGFAFFGGAARRGDVADGLCGEPVSPGVYEGRIRVVHDPSQTKLTPGEILCCHGTDPSWTPLFLSAGALVMEVGGAMTHGSVVAREYGIPAIVGLEGVTEKLVTGQLVRVDGSSGIVEFLDDNKTDCTK
jgi:phosphohistidine swiveling domain-containing protein